MGGSEILDRICFLRKEEAVGLSVESQEQKECWGLRRECVMVEIVFFYE